MRTKKFKLFFIVVIILAISGWFIFKIKRNNFPEEIVKEITPVAGVIKDFISSTGTVLPKNRLEIKPPVNGRIEKILVEEGDKVKTGQILAWMSSTERAALLDSARGKGEKELQYWEDIYKPIPLPAPIDGEVIVAKTQPGQTITTADAVLVLSDQLIVRAQVDETDIGKITLDKEAVISLDAYPDVKIKAFVGHIYYESKTVNNVTVYEVDLKSNQVPEFFRSGMNAAVDFIEKEKENALLIPEEAVSRRKDGNYVFLKQKNATGVLNSNLNGSIPVAVELGVSDGKNVEVLSGITEDDRIIIKEKKYSLPQSNSGTNPFMPNRKR